MANAPKVIFDEDRALVVFSALCQMWREKTWIFRDVVLPEDQFPLITDPETNARWKFFAALPQTAGVMAEDPFKQLWWLLQNIPELFDPTTVAKSWSPERIVKAMKSVSPDLLKFAPIGVHDAGALGFKLYRHAEHWHHNCVTITEKFGGNVLTMFDMVSKKPFAEQFEAAFSLVDGKQNKKGLYIKGMQRKIFSLFVIWLQKEKVIPYFPCPIPVDFHALRVLKGTETISFTHTTPVPEIDPVRATKGKKKLVPLFGLDHIKLTEPVRDEVAIWTHWFLLRNGLSHLDANPAIWALSREVCATHPQNTARGDGQKYLLADMLSGSPELWPKQYRDLCRHCPLDSMCTNVTPAHPHYQGDGALVYIDRVPYPFRQPVQEILGGSGKELLTFRGHKYSRSKAKTNNGEPAQRIAPPVPTSPKPPVKEVQSPLWSPKGHGASQQKQQPSSRKEKARQARTTK